MIPLKSIYDTLSPIQSSVFRLFAKSTLSLFILLNSCLGWPHPYLGIEMALAPSSFSDSPEAAHILEGFLASWAWSLIQTAYVQVSVVRGVTLDNCFHFFPFQLPHL